LDDVTLKESAPPPKSPWSVNKKGLSSNITVEMMMHV
jgi:hypothetical protein